MQGRYAHLNLRWNPFGEATPEERGALAHVDVESFRQSITPACAIELRGGHGRGKSTTLLALRHTLSPKAPLYRGRQQRSEPLPISTWVFLDEVQHIPVFKLWQFARRMYANKGIVIYSTHANRRWLFKLAGFSIQKHIMDYAQPEILLTLFNKRIAWAHNHQGPTPQIHPKDIQQLSTLYGDDIRGMEGHLYDSINRLKSPEQPIIPRSTT